MQDDLATLCQSCGLCCDGSLFARAALEPDEIAHARTKRLRVLADGRGFEQPCAALGAPDRNLRRACSIYPERPRACRRFTCRLYERHWREGGPIETRLAVVRRVRAIVAELEAAGLAPEDFEGDRARIAALGDAGERAARAFRDLVRLLEEDLARA
jgi:Fe-S-cluster containining protein